MAEVDTSIYNKLTAPRTSVLGTLQGYTDLQNAQNQNAMFQQQFAARKAMGPILQQSVDPATGQVDYSKATTLMAMNPDTAFMAPQFASDAITRQGAQADVMTKDLENAHKMTTSFGERATGLLAKWGDPSQAKQSDAIGALADLYGAGLIDRDRAIALTQGLPADGAPLWDKMRQMALQAEGASAALKDVFGTMNTIGAGNRTQMVATSPLMGTTKDMGAIMNGVSPEQANALIPGKTQEGAPTLTPRASIAPMAGANAQGIIPAGQEPSVQTNPLAPIPAAPQAGEDGQSAGGASPALAPNPSSPSIIVGPTATTEKHNEAMGQKMADYESDLNTAVSNVTNQMQTLQLAREALKTFQTGGGVETKTRLAQLAQAAGMPQATVDKIAGGDLAAAQEFEKVMVGQSMANLKQMAGSGQRFTNFEFEKFSDANPNLNTDPRAVDKILGVYQKMGNLVYKEQQALDKYKDTGEPLDKFPAWWSQQLVKSGVVKFPTGDKTNEPK